MVENDFRSTYRGWNPHFPLYVSCSTSSLLRSAYQYLRTRLKIKSVEIRFQLWNYSLVVQNRKISVTFTYCLVFTYLFYINLWFIDTIWPNINDFQVSILTQGTSPLVLSKWNTLACTGLGCNWSLCHI